VAAVSALAAAGAFARQHDLPADDLVVLKDGSNLVVHLRPAPVIVRVATVTARVRLDPWPYIEREVALVSFLAAEGAPVMRPSDLVEPGPHQVGGWLMSAWQFVVGANGTAPSPVGAFRALDALHTVMRRYPQPLPLLNPAGEDLDLALRLCVDTGMLLPDEAAARAELRDELRNRLLALAQDIQPLHGDAFTRNALMTPTGPVWIDLEDCCSGPRIWDLATLVMRDPDAALVSEVERRYGQEALQLGMALRQVQEDVWRLIHAARKTQGWFGEARPDVDPDPSQP
jgi:Phosphotransferase enzyme family